MKIYVVIPAFNEEKRIRKVISGIKKFTDHIIVVDDGSVDATFKVAAKLKNKISPPKADQPVAEKIKILRHRVNLGKGAALKTGVEAAFQLGAEAVVFMDADGQHSPSDFPKFVEKLEQGYDVVLGSRNYIMGVPLIRFLGNKSASLLISFLFGIFVTDLLCGYRGIKREAFNAMKLESSDYAIETEMIIKIKRKNLKYAEVPVATVYMDSVKGVTILDAVNIFFEVIRWRLTK